MWVGKLNDNVCFVYLYVLCISISFPLPSSEKKKKLQKRGLHSTLKTKPRESNK